MFSVLVLFFSVIISAIIVERFNISGKILQLLLAFSGAFLLTLAFAHIIPNIFDGEHNSVLGFFVLLGFVIQLLIEYLTGGAEHGHGHCNSDDHLLSDNHHGHHHEHGSVISPYALLIGISLHAFFEGMPFAEQFHGHEHTHNTLLMGIIIHKIPIAVALMGLFLSAKLSKIKSYILILLFAISAPLGVMFGGEIAGLIGVDIDYSYKIIMAMLVGIFLHVSTTILFESNTSHKFNIYKLITIFIGMGLAISLNFL